MAKRKKDKKQKSSMVAKITAVAACITAVLTATNYMIPTGTPLLTQLFPHLGDNIRFQWNTLDFSSVLYSNKSQITIIDDNSDSYYDCGVELDVQYSNYSKKHRTISSFTVTATNISIDYRPVFEYSYTYEVSELAATESILNNGWGSSGELVFELIDIRPSNPADADIVTVSLRDDAKTSWTYPALEPGESGIFAFTQRDDLVFEYHETDYDHALYLLEYSVRNQENTISDTILLALYINSNSIRFENAALGDSDCTFYIIEVDTSESNWTHTFPIQQSLPAETTVSLPIFIMPNRSCTMDLEIILETSDGDIYKADILKGAYFKVPYHQEWTKYVSGEFIDWNNTEENRIVYFPYTNSEQYFPNP